MDNNYLPNMYDDDYLPQDNADRHHEREMADGEAFDANQISDYDLEDLSEKPVYDYLGRIIGYRNEIRTKKGRKKCKHK